MLLGLRSPWRMDDSWRYFSPSITYSMKLEAFYYEIAPFFCIYFLSVLYLGTNSIIIDISLFL